MEDVEEELLELGELSVESVEGLAYAGLDCLVDVSAGAGRDGPNSIPNSRSLRTSTASDPWLDLESRWPGWGECESLEFKSQLGCKPAKVAISGPAGLGGAFGPGHSLAPPALRTVDQASSER